MQRKKGNGGTVQDGGKQSGTPVRRNVAWLPPAVGRATKKKKKTGRQGPKLVGTLEGVERAPSTSGI